MTGVQTCALPISNLGGAHPDSLTARQHEGPQLIGLGLKGVECVTVPIGIRQDMGCVPTVVGARRLWVLSHRFPPAESPPQSTQQKRPNEQRRATHEVEIRQTLVTGEDPPLCSPTNIHVERTIPALPACSAEQARWGEDVPAIFVERHVHKRLGEVDGMLGHEALLSVPDEDPLSTDDVEASAMNGEGPHAREGR